MAKRYFTEKEFSNNYGKEMATAINVYDRMIKNGFEENALATFDFDFISDKKESLNSLRDFLEDNYDFKLALPQKQGKLWILEGDSVEHPYTEENLMFWALDLYCRGYEFDCILNGYGTLTDPQKLIFQNLDTVTSESYHEKGIDALNKRNFGAAIIYFSIALKLDPNSAETWHARGYCKDEIHTWKAARKDYDQALKINPNFVDALIIRATNKDDNGEYEDALKDYNRAIEIEPEVSLSYFNRGNTKFNLGDKKGAFEDWNKAKSLGSPYAQARIDACK